jgi:hypothetical protein
LGKILDGVNATINAECACADGGGGPESSNEYGNVNDIDSVLDSL